MSHNPPLGQIITAPQEKDAIHVAIAPVVAAHTLMAAQHVGLNPNGEAAASGIAGNIGVVDPFLKQPVLKGEKFWLFVYPNTITSLRHDWSHPAFVAAAPAAVAAESAKQRFAIIAEDFGIGYDDMMRGAEEYQRTGEWDDSICANSSSDLPSNFWDLYSLITGKAVTHYGKFFSCSC